MKKRLADGLTLIELLVGLLVFGILLAALLSLETATVTGANTAALQAARIRNLQEASSYLAARLRAARLVSTDLSVNDQACSLTPPAGTLPCFAILVGETRTVGGVTQYQDNAYSYLVYRLIPRLQLTAADRAPDTWADSNTYALTQSQVLLCEPTATSCTTAVPATPPSVAIPTVMPTALAITPAVTATHTLDQVVADMSTLDLTPGSGTFTPFAYNAASRQFTLRFRQKTNERGTVRYTPASEPYLLHIQRRN
ncbi:prepilin-type N-terminal cleavage/methylation domain-containing protein [Deinococcus frigens]|uniref:prepilin-type N-terminal cleavage/methylation domain-containing protein n=1 Tax=Deinococcus frigens TaxID=249403 RepID=UPI000495A7A9|nr:prepilin-type N-terminal cleavage/methylation domain-containing protein [Deinococcus frigens]